MSHARTLSRISVQSAPESFNNIKVIARFRPESEAEKNHTNAYNMIRFASDDTCQIIDAKERQISSQSPSFTFDRVFDLESKQSDVFDFSLRQTVDDLLKGYNGTVLAYGQTGSGKSHTMMGPNMDDPELRGAIPRIVDHIFALIQQSPGDIEYTVRVSYMEIYMEKIKDLLNVANDNLPIHEDKARGVHVKGLTEHYVTSAKEVFEIMKQGASVRSVASTNMNSESSRSHSIFALVVTQKNVDTGSQKSGQLFLVDLAGSEKVGKTGASGQTLEEAKKINKSLSALGNVINALTDGKSSHIPYRDSKLTRILQESLGGNSRTSLIVNCSPSSYNDQETISTLRFGVRAKTIKNMAKINAELSPSELRSILRKVHAQLEARTLYDQKLENELIQWRNNSPPDKQDWVEFIRNSITRPTTPGLSPSNSGVETPTSLRRPKRTESELDSIDEYLQRENEIQDILAEKDNYIDALQRELDSKASSQSIEIDRLLYEKQELHINVSSLKQEIQRLKQQIESSKEEAMQTKIKYEEAMANKVERPVINDVSTDSDIDEAISFEPRQNLPTPIQDVMRMTQSKLNALTKTQGDLKYFYKERCRISDETINQLLTEIERLPKQHAYNPASDKSHHLQNNTGQIQALQTHISQIESMKQNLMRDLQDRCERIVELEISLDQAREQYDIAFENNNVKQQQRKIVILERNLDQLTQVQRQVIEQNTSLKKEVKVSQKLLESRNQRIKDLERSLSQSKLTLARELDTYESRLGFLKDKVFEIRNIRKVPTNTMGLKIIKPIRGGVSEENLKRDD